MLHCQVCTSRVALYKKVKKMPEGNFCQHLKNAKRKQTEKLFTSLQWSTQTRETRLLLKTKQKKQVGVVLLGYLEFPDDFGKGCVLAAVLFQKGHILVELANISRVHFEIRSFFHKDVRYGTMLVPVWTRKYHCDFYKKLKVIG